MKDVFEILNGYFKIIQIIIENFTILDHNLSIRVKISSSDFGNNIITFEGVSRININSEYYVCSDKSSMTIEDLSDAQLEGIKYKIAISEEAMTFYCNEIRLT